MRCTTGMSLLYLEPFSIVNIMGSFEGVSRQMPKIPCVRVYGKG